MILELNGTKVTIVDKTLGYQGDNLVNTIQVTVDKDSTWNYKLDMYKGKSKCFDSVLMTRDGNVCTVQLTNEILSYGGRYIFQLRGYTDTQTYHSDIFESWVNASIEYQGDCKQACECDCKLPTEFYQVEDNVTEINNHPPYPGDNGKWMIWDVDKHEYVESDIEVVGGGGTLYITWVDNGKITADHTIAEIREAYGSNKAIIGALYSSVSKSYQFIGLDTIDSRQIVFSYTTYVGGDFPAIKNFVIAGAEQNGQDVWTSQFIQKDLANYQTKSNMDSEIDQASSPNKYPSSKAVYDFVTENANNYIVNISLSTNDDSLTVIGDKTYDEIKSALDNNRNVVAVVKQSDKIISYAYVNTIASVSDNRIVFYEIADGQYFFAYIVTSLNQWTLTSIKFITEHDVTTTMTSPSDNLVPTSKAVQSALDLKLDKTSIVQSTGTSTTDVMSQKAVTEVIQNQSLYVNQGVLAAKLKAVTIVYPSTAGGTDGKFVNQDGETILQSVLQSNVIGGAGRNMIFPVQKTGSSEWQRITWFKSQIDKSVYDFAWYETDGTSARSGVDRLTMGTTGVFSVVEQSSLELGGGGTDISLGLTGASVGDIVKVKAVDDNGMPTEWEALGFRKIREFTLPDDPSTDASDITYNMCTVEGYTDKIAQCIFNTDDNGNSFSVKETILVAKWGYVRSNNYYSMADQNGGLGYGNIFANRLTNNTLRTFVYYTRLDAGMRFTIRFESDFIMNNMSGIYTTPPATDDYNITTIKIGTFLDQAMLSGSSFAVYGR